MADDPDHTTGDELTPWERYRWFPVLVWLALVLFVVSFFRG